MMGYFTSALRYGTSAIRLDPSAIAAAANTRSASSRGEAGGALKSAIDGSSSSATADAPSEGKKKRNKRTAEAAVVATATATPAADPPAAAAPARTKRGNRTAAAKEAPAAPENPAPVAALAAAVEGEASASSETSSKRKSARAPAKPRRKHLSLEEKVAIIAANSCGRCCAEIAEQFGRDASTVSRFLRSYAATGSLESKPGRGMKRKTSDNDDGAIEKLLETAAKANGGELPARLTSKDVLQALPTLGVSERTVRRRIAELGGGRKKRTAGAASESTSSSDVAPSATAEL